MRLRFSTEFFNQFFLWIFCLLGSLTALQAEGSIDFRDYPGYRLFFNAEQKQQLKVYATEGETINLGTSHVGISGGFIAVYRPDGTLHYVFNGSDGLGIINNDVEEINGPTGSGITNGNGYIPAVVAVGVGQAGIWTVRFEYPTYSQDSFENLMNDAPWNRFDQPVDQRVVLAWDITVSQGGAANMGGTMLEGRVYSNEYISIQNGNGIMTSPSFFILTKDGFQYRIDFKDTDPWGFPIFSNSVGLVTAEGEPCYQSLEQTNYNRSDRPTDWTVGNKYLYEPQTEDVNNIINNKIFFNPPDPNLPTSAMVTDVNTFNTHTTWLYTELIEPNPEFEEVGFKGVLASNTNSLCKNDLVTEVGKGGQFNFKVNTNGTAKISLDLNANGVFTDEVDRVYFQRVEEGENSLFWDGKNGIGMVIPATLGFRINYKMEVRGGEIHIMMLDVENNPGGVTFTRLNGLESPSKEYYYDHSAIGGSVSGDGSNGNPRATIDPFTYDEKFGNNRLLDYWTYIEYSSSENGSLGIDIIPDCSEPIVDSDNDLIPDFQDIDDDNDGIADFSEYCNPEGDFVCLPGGFDPSGDSDNDKIPNYLDSSDPAINNECVDANEDGICDRLSIIYDTDKDGVPDHLDLDSDNDGITDLVEAGHLQVDIDGDGIIDGDASFFGKNGLFNAIASDPDSLTAFEIYTRYDVDSDGVPDHDDLDSDNDGINDIAEANFEASDSNGDGRIDDGLGNPPTVSATGLTPILDPAITNLAIPLPPDTDVDGVPDWHDLDSDNDGINDVEESVKTDFDSDGIVGKGQPIVDQNGQAISDADGKPLSTTSKPTNTDELAAADFRDLDADEDGINDVDEADQPDLDADGIVGSGVPVVNDKGQITQDGVGNPIVVISNPDDTDSDQKPDFQDIDRDGDGIGDAYECPGGWPCINSDNDLLPDVDDLDSDDDLLLDKEECPGGAPCPDSDTNTIDNFLEYDCNARNTPSPSKPSGGGQFCEGTPIQLNASGDTAFTDIIRFSWTGPNDFEFFKKGPANGGFPVDLSSVSAASSGTYELTLETERGCQSEPIKVVVDLMEKPEAPTLSVAKEKLCAGEDTQLEVNTYSGESVNYIWYQQSDGKEIAIDTTEIATLLFENTKTDNSGIYTAVVLVNGCESSVSNAKRIDVKVPIESPIATSSATIINPACEGETVNLSVPFREGATYEWSGPNNFIADQAAVTIPNATNTYNGNYNAVVTFEGCAVRTNDVTVMVFEQPATPVLKMVEEKQCEGQEAILKIIEPVSYSNENVVFNWYVIGNSSPIGTTETSTLEITNLDESDNGDYYVEVTQLGCVSEASNVQSIEVQTRIPVTASSSAEVDNPACEGDMVRLTGSLFTNATYEWYGPNGLITDKPSYALTDATPAQNGEYTFVVTIDNCPSASKPVPVRVNPKPATPVLQLDNSEPCTGENINLSISNAGDIPLSSTVKVDWFNADTEALVNSTEDIVWQIENLEDIDAGAYYSVLTIDGCASEVSNTQAITTQPGLESVTIFTNAEASVSPVCESSQVNLAVPFEEGINYQWYGPEGIIDNTTNSLIIENAGTDISGAYYLVREKGGCSRITESVEIQVTKMPTTPILANIEGTQCLDGTITLNINNPQEMPGGNEVEYSWYHVQTDERVGTSTQPIFTLSNLTAKENGNYYVVLTVDGCSTPASNYASIIVQEPSVSLVATASAGIETPICAGENLSLDVPFMVGATYEWFGPNGFTSDKPNPNLSAVSMVEAGGYYAVVNIDGCPILTNNLEIQINPRPETPSLSIDANEKCEGETAELRVTKPTIFPDGTNVTYEWFATNSDVSLATTTTPNFNQKELTTTNNGSFYAIVNQDGCQSSFSNIVDLEVSKVPNEIAFIMEDNESVCNQSEINIEAIQPMIGKGQWSSENDLSFVDPLNASTILLEVPTGENKIYWTLSYKGCKDYSKDSLIISQATTLIEATDDEFTISLNNTLNGVSVTANDLVMNTEEVAIKLMSEPANGQLTLENGRVQYEPNTNFFGEDMFAYEICAANCPDQCDVATVRVKVIDNAVGADCFAPNIITPNNDGRNDYLKIPCVESQTQSELKVFNRWGDLVHETENYNNNWAGTYNGNPLPNGTYFYLLQMDGMKQPMQGYFTIVR